MKSFALIAGSVFGMTGVILGAFGAHALKNSLTPELLSSFETGVRYQMYHAFLLLFLGTWMQFYPSKMLDVSAGLIFTGILLFSGSIYLLSTMGLKQVALATPLGGLVLIIGWLLITIHFIQQLFK